MHYSIRHLTKFRYSAAISESVMEVRMQPRTEGRAALHLVRSRGQTARKSDFVPRSSRQPNSPFRRAQSSRKLGHQGGGRGRGFAPRFA